MVDSLGSTNRVARRVDEALRRDPQVVVVEQRDRIPLAREQDVQHVHDVRAVRDDDARLDVRLGDVVRRGRVDRVDGRRADVVVLEGIGLGGRAAAAVHGLVLLLVVDRGHAEVAGFEVLEAVAVRFELAGDFAGVVVPLLRGAEADAESGVVLGVVEIYYLPKDGLAEVRTACFTERRGS